jgi:primase-polymerase (primpol)-like protein
VSNYLSIADLKLQRRWVLWRLENTAKATPTKRPYQPDGHLASSIDPATWHTFAELEPLVSRFSGIGLVLGTVDGVSVWGVDIDKCCDVATGKFSPESRAVVIALDSRADFALCVLLAQKFGCDAFKIDDEFRGSGLYRDKWEREDYSRSHTTESWGLEAPSTAGGIGPSTGGWSSRVRGRFTYRQRV